MSKSLNGLNDYVKDKVELLLRNANMRLKNYKMVITEAYRSIEYQNQLYAQGRSKPGKIVTNAKGGQSMHNYGYAVDFALMTPDGKKYVWDTKIDTDKDGQADWMEVVDEAKKCGFEWGGDWKSFKDYPHFQMTGGLTDAQVRAGMKPNFDNQKSFIKESVEQLQKDLIYLGYNVGKDGADGIVGADTKEAIKKFQNQKGLEVDGIAGPNTRTAIEEAIKIKRDAKVYLPLDKVSEKSDNMYRLAKFVDSMDPVTILKLKSEGYKIIELPKK